MEEVLLRQLVRQLKIINIWISFFGVVFVATLIIIAILIFKMVTFVHNTEQSISKIQQKTEQTLDVQKQICGTSGVSSILDKTTNYCK